MAHNSFTVQYAMLGRTAAWAVFSLTLIYAVTTVLGLRSLKSPEEPIGDPYFAVMELLTILIAPLMVITMVAVHAYASPEAKAFSLTALVFMILMAGITCSVHFVILTVGRQIEATGLPWARLLLSFTWPSVAYALDILAWDVFFALSMLFAAPVFKQGSLELAVRYLMIASGVLSLLGLIGVPLKNMNARNIGIVGYALVAPVAFLLLALVLGRAGDVLGYAM